MSDLAGDRSPEDTLDELEAVDVGAAPGAPAPPAPELGGPTIDRQKIRAVWLGVGGGLEAFLGPAMRHTPAEIDQLTEASIPLAEAFGLEWLGNWVLVLGFAGTVAAIEFPKLRQLRPTEAPPVEAEATAQPVTADMRDELGPQPTPTSR